MAVMFEVTITTENGNSIQATVTHLTMVQALQEVVIKRLYKPTITIVVKDG